MEVKEARSIPVFQVAPAVPPLGVYEYNLKFGTWLLGTAPCPGYEYTTRIYTLEPVCNLHIKTIAAPTCRPQCFTFAGKLRYEFESSFQLSH